MNHPSHQLSLKESIEMLKLRQMQQVQGLKEDMAALRENLKPANLIRDTLQEVTHSDDMKANIGKVAFGLLSGYLSKKVFFHNSTNPVKKLLGVAFQTMITGVAAQNSDVILEKGKDLMHYIGDLIRKKKHPSADDEIASMHATV